MSQPRVVGKDSLVDYGLTVPQKELVPHSAPQCLKKVWGTIGRPNLRLSPMLDQTRSKTSLR